jgi:hypothetical protein
MGLFDFVGNIGKKLFGPKETPADSAAKIKAEIESGNLGIKDLHLPRAEDPPPGHALGAPTTKGEVAMLMEIL